MKKEIRKGENFIRTGVFIDRDDYMKVLEAQHVAKQAPIKVIPNFQKLGVMPTFAQQAWLEVRQLINGFGLKKGLPKLDQGANYALAVNGEFIMALDATEEPLFIERPPKDFSVDSITEEDLERIRRMPDKASDGGGIVEDALGLKRNVTDA